MTEQKPKLFISYKTGLDDGLSFTATTVRDKLESLGYDVWMDTSGLEPGKEWNKQILDEVTSRDILLLLIANETIESNWVRREVDIAKGARVTIIPVLIRNDFKIKEALETFDLAYVQYVKLLTGSKDEYSALEAAIMKSKDDTRNAQQEWIRQLKEGQKRHPAPAAMHYATYMLSSSDNPPDSGSYLSLCRVHIAAGNMFEHKGIHVYVNTENDYMQMARVFEETKTISAFIRYYGSQLDEAERVLEDTIQDEIDEHISKYKHPERGSAIGTRPVGIGTVIATSAGLPGSHLRVVNRARYVFHTAAVSVIGDSVEKTLECTLMEAGIKRCVRKTLLKIKEVNKAKGVISPEKSKQRKEQEENKEKYEDIHSIILPIFGAGHGGRPSREIIPALVKGVKEVLIDQRDDPEFTLTDIYLAAYFQEDVKCMEEVFKADKHFQLVPGMVAGN